MNLLITSTTMSDLPKDCIFTKRQIEVLQVWSEESSVQKVAERLGVSHHTIGTQLNSQVLTNRHWCFAVIHHYIENTICAIA